MVNILKEIEDRYPVDRVLVNRKQVWPLLRIKYDYIYNKITSERDIQSTLMDQSLIQKIKMIKNIFYGLFNWFRRYDFIAISNSREGIKKKINNTYYDRLIDPIIDVMGEDSFLYIEKPFPIHHPKKEVHTKRVVSYYFILFLVYILEKFIKLPKIDGVKTLESIKKDYNIIINEHILLKHFYSKKKVYKIIYKFLRPKMIFIVSYYDNMAAINAAKELGIRVVEVQHGSIGNEHPAYNTLLDLDGAYFPDYLLAFGERDIAPFVRSKYIDHENVCPIGSYYLEYVKEQLKPDSRLIKELSKYNRRVGVTLQWTVEEKVIDFVVKAALLDSSILYLLIPRFNIHKEYSNLTLPENVEVVADKDFYETMMYVDFHSTAYSTCALEAPSLGVQNIMINVEDTSKIHFEKVLDDKNITKFVDTPEEYVEAILYFKILDFQTIIQSNEKNIVSNYIENLNKFIKKLDIE